MDLSQLPSQTADIESAIAETESKGPAALAELAMLCLWLVGQRDEDPREVYEGPGGRRPLDYLLMDMERDCYDTQPRFYRPVVKWTEEYPKPAAPTRGGVPGVPEDDAKQQVAAVMSEADEPDNADRRLFLCSQGLNRLARSGIARSHLEPLIRVICDHWSAEEDYFGRSAEALLYAGELQQAKKMLAAFPVSNTLIDTKRINCAKILVETDRHEEARRLLEELLAERNRLHHALLHVEAGRIAEVYAYLGDPVTARDLIGAAPMETRLIVERMIAWNGYINRQSIDLSAIVQLARETVEIQCLNGRAHEQTDLLHFLLSVKAYDAAWQVLALVQETLLKIELWGDERWGTLAVRTNDAAAVLWPYVDQHPERIAAFVSDLLVSKAMDRGERTSGMWPMAHMVSGVGFLIKHWAGHDEVDRLNKFLRWWRDVAT